MTKLITVVISIAYKKNRSKICSIFANNLYINKITNEGKFSNTANKILKMFNSLVWDI